jgi:hypothetical protein
VQRVKEYLHVVDARGCSVTATRGRSNVYVLVKAALHISPITSENVFYLCCHSKPQTAHRELFT